MVWDPKRAQRVAAKQKKNSFNWKQAQFEIEEDLDLLEEDMKASDQESEDNTHEKYFDVVI
jgi:hypothetical protein